MMQKQNQFFYCNSDLKKPVGKSMKHVKSMNQICNALPSTL